MGTSVSPCIEVGYKSGDVAVRLKSPVTPISKLHSTDMLCHLRARRGGAGGGGGGGG